MEKLSILVVVSLLNLIRVDCQSISESESYLQCRKMLNLSMVKFLERMDGNPISMEDEVERRKIAETLDKTLNEIAKVMKGNCSKGLQTTAEYLNTKFERTPDILTIHQVSVQRFELEIPLESPVKNNPYHLHDWTRRMFYWPGDLDDKPVTNFKRQIIRDMMSFAWSSYKRSISWGHGLIYTRATSPGRHHWSYVKGLLFWDAGATIVTSMDTLFIMNLTQQYAEGRDWIEKYLTFNNPPGRVLDVRRTIIGYLGGLLSTYALTRDEMFKQKAVYIAENILKAYNDNGELPYDWYQLGPNETVMNNLDDRIKEMSPFAALSLEFDYLSEVTGRKEFSDKNQVALELAKTWSNNKPLRGLLRNYFLLHFPNSKWTRFSEAIARSDGHYLDYLLKSWIRGRSSNSMLRDTFIDASERAIDSLVRKSRGNLTYVGFDFEFFLNRTFFVMKRDKMSHTTCYVGGMLALAAAVLKDDRFKDRYLELGAAITHTCHEAYVRTISKLAPVLYGFADDPLLEARYDMVNTGNELFTYHLSSPAAEAYFVMWRLTHNPIYREWGYELAVSIDTHCKVKDGYVGKLNVEDGLIGDNLQHSVFLSETLKYLFLLFSEDDVLPLDEWVFNGNAHPFPIQGTSAFKDTVFKT